MKPLYQNFDGLDIAFQGALPETILNQLKEARDDAQQEKRDVYTNIGPESMPVMVAETGAKGGYKYRFDTGMDGEVWFIAHSLKRDNWNIRVSVKSPSLALHGYQGVKERILNRLAVLQAVGPYRPDHVQGGMIETPRERISRVDYCLDFVMDSTFLPQSSHFIAHQRCGKHTFGTQEKYDAATGDQINTIRIGTMPGREATIYNKTKEIAVKNKSYWWDVWGLDKAAFTGTIWRVEMRAGKDELDKWNLKTFADFEAKAGDVIHGILTAIRYTQPLLNDANRSRWPLHPLWEAATGQAMNILAPYSSRASRGKIITDQQQAVINRYRNHIAGMVIALTAAQGLEIEEMDIVLKDLQRDIAQMLKRERVALIKKFQRARDKFSFSENGNPQK